MTTTTELRDYKRWAKSLRNFTWLRQSKAPGAQDIDALIHDKRENRFLVVEGKPLMGTRVYVPYGQWLTLRGLAALPSHSVLLVAEGKDGMYGVLHVQPDMTAQVVRHNGQHHVVLGLKSFAVLNLDGLVALVDEWWGE
jgi:uncharacterized heparinase superfamily protein